jgi:general stress protein 26
MRWIEIEQAHPEFATRLAAIFDAHPHKVMATVSRDGSPRISGTEMRFLDGDAWIGSMADARKLADLRRDPRVAVHCAPIDLTLASGDAKLSAAVIEATPADIERWEEASEQVFPPGSGALFWLDITSAAITRVSGNRLVIDTWSEAGGHRTVDRA